MTTYSFRHGLPFQKHCFDGVLLDFVIYSHSNHDGMSMASPAPSFLDLTHHRSRHVIIAKMVHNALIACEPQR